MKGRTKKEVKKKGEYFVQALRLFYLWRMEGEGEREKKVAVVVVVVVVQEYHKVVARLVGQASQSAGCVQNRHATEETSFGRKKDRHFLFFQNFPSKLEYLSPFLT
jgi:O-glycosyl hydrolase